MARGGPRPGSGPAPKLKADGTRANPKRAAPQLGEAPRPRGRPAKLNADGTRVNPPKGAKAVMVPVAPTVATPQTDFSSLPFPDVAVDEMPLEVLLKVMRDKKMHPEVRLRAAQVALPFTAQKPSEAKLGKREQKIQDAGEIASEGTFAPGRPPLSVVGRGG